MTRARDLADNAENTKPKVINAKGDLIVGTGSDAADRLAAGNNGEQLLADSSATTGLRWTATPTASNPVINSAFDIWQRGTSIAGSSTAYTADRWQGYRTVAGSTFSRQATGDTTNLPNIQYCMRAQRDSGNTSTNILLLQYTMETADSIPFAGKTITFSFYARRGANFSSASNNLELNVTSGTGTDQNGITGFTGAVAVINAQQSALTTTWQRFTYTASVGATATQLTWGFRYTPSGTAGAADFFEVTGIQIDIGSVALPYRRYAATLQGELAACQRYFEKSYNIDVTPGTNTQVGMVFVTAATDDGNNVGQLIQFKVNKRVTPTLTGYREDGANNNWQYSRSGVAYTDAAVTFGFGGTNTAFPYVGTGAAWVPARAKGHWTASAEL